MLLDSPEFSDQVIFYLSKKILKNVKFGLQVHIHMEIMLNGSDRPLGLSKWKYESVARANPCYA